tara:strand:- start:3071 stop:4627 length:1557 start_codon:yes stop_codon:yes gene_type:complete
MEKIGVLPMLKKASVATGKPLAGVKRGVYDVMEGASQGLVHGAAAITPDVMGARGAMGDYSKGIDATVAQNERNYQATRDGSFDIGRLIGNIAGIAPLAAMAPATLGGATAAGMASGGLQPVYGGDYATEKSKQMGIGGAGGFAGGLIGKGISRVLAPKTSAAAKEMLDAGVTPTPGQIMGGTANAVEQKLTSVPIVGDAIAAGRRRAMGQFNTATINKALSPIGHKISGKITGREAIETAGRRVSEAYDDIVPKMTFKADQRFASELTNLRSLAKNLSKDGAEQFDNIVQNQVISKLAPETGMASGETLKTMTSEIGRLGVGYSKSSAAGERELGSALRELQRVIKSAASRNSPKQAMRLSQVDKAYSMLLRIENAAGRAGSKEGVFTPAGLRAAVKQLDSSMRKRNFARGKAPMQRFAESAENVLGSTVPDSGTPGRLATGGLGLAGLAAFNLPVAIATALGGGAAMLPYSPIGQKAAAALLASRPASMRAAGKAIDRMSPFMGAAAPLGLLNNRP